MLCKHALVLQWECPDEVIKTPAPAPRHGVAGTESPQTCAPRAWRPTARWAGARAGVRRPSGHRPVAGRRPPAARPAPPDHYHERCTTVDKLCRLRLSGCWLVHNSGLHKDVAPEGRHTRPACADSRHGRGRPDGGCPAGASGHKELGTWGRSGTR